MQLFLIKLSVINPPPVVPVLVFKKYLIVNLNKNLFQDLGKPLKQVQVLQEADF